MKMMIPLAYVEKMASDRKMIPSIVGADFEKNTTHLALNDFEDLHRLADRLIVPLSDVLAQATTDLDDGIKVCRRDEGFIRKSERAGHAYYTYQHLATSSDAPELMALRVSVHCQDENNVVLNGGHKSKELIYVTKGKIRMHWQTNAERRSVDLTCGDSVYLRPNVSHSFMSLEGDAELLAFNY